MHEGKFFRSTHAEYKHLDIAEHHDGGFSMYAIGKKFNRDGGHLYMSGNGGDRSWDPASKNGFSMVINKYASAMDFAEIVTHAKEITCPMNIDRMRDAENMKSSDQKWYGGFKKITDGYEMIRDGWEEGAKKAVNTLSNASIPEINGIESMRRTLVFADYGETLNLDQAMAGNWEKAWQTCRRIRSGVSRVLSIAIPFGGNCGMTSEQLFWNGAQGMIITDILEDKGYRVQLYGVYVSEQTCDGHLWDIDIVDLKKSDEPLRMDGIAAVVAHAGVFRTAGFLSVIARPCKISFGLGHCLEGKVPEAMEAVAKLGYLHPGMITLDAAYSKEQASKRISEFFERMKQSGERLES
jgi:hypothetical protein